MIGSCRARMSALRLSRNEVTPMNRPKTYTAAAIVQFLLSAMNGIGSIPFLMRGAATPDNPPFFVELVLFATAILGFISAYGVWRNQRWGVLVTIGLCILTGL